LTQEPSLVKPNRRPNDCPHSRRDSFDMFV
jgi:hypothetical protein